MAEMVGWNGYESMQSNYHLYQSPLLILGILFPALGWFSFIASTVKRLRTGKPSSGVYIPFIGPMLIDMWLRSVGAQPWTMILPWMADIGTLHFIWMMPRLLSEIWRYSRWTRLFVLSGSHENQTVLISFHKGGHYVLKKNWQRPAGETGIVSLGEPGTFICDGNGWILTSYLGGIRQITSGKDHWYVVDPASPLEYRIDGWSLNKG